MLIYKLSASAALIVLKLIAQPSTNLHVHARLVGKNMVAKSQAFCKRRVNPFRQNASKQRHVEFSNQFPGDI